MGEEPVTPLLQINRLLHLPQLLLHALDPIAIPAIGMSNDTLLTSTLTWGTRAWLAL
jgi:hypothetical protein